MQTHRYKLRLAAITHGRKLISEPLAIVWDQRRALPRYAQDFCDTLAAHMRELRPLTEPQGAKANSRRKR